MFPLDIWLQISEYLPISDVYNLLLAEKFLYNNERFLLQNKRNDVNSLKNSNLWCTVCNNKIRECEYILCICSCLTSDNFPSYHLNCVPKVPHKCYTVLQCVHCKIHKMHIFCNIAS